MPTVELSFSALPAHVRTARLVAAAVARRAGLQESLLDEVRLAVGEACTRAVDLHRQFCPETPVRVELSHDDDHFEVLVRDSAPTEGLTAATAFEALHDDSAAGTGEPAPGAAVLVPTLGSFGPKPSARGGPPEADLQPLPPGVGLAVIGGIVDEVDVEADETGSRVRMRWPVSVQQREAGSRSGSAR